MATKPRNRYCADCQSGISCYQHMGICKKIAFIACDLCWKYKCYQERCIDKICCAESYARMNSERKTCGKEVLARNSKMSPLRSALAVSPRPRISLPRVADDQTALSCTTLPCVPAASGPGPAMFANDNKTDDGLPTILNEERKQVTAHTNLTQNASTIDCVRYSDNGKEKQESNDTSSEEKALNDDKCEKGDLQTQASKQEAQARTIAKATTTTSPSSTTTKETSICSTVSSKSGQGSRHTEGA